MLDGSSASDAPGSAVGSARLLPLDLEFPAPRADPWGGPLQSPDLLGAFLRVTTLHGLPRVFEPGTGWCRFRAHWKVCTA